MGEESKIIEFISQHYTKQPWSTDFQHVILDALFSLGKNENDFDWIEKPTGCIMGRTRFPYHLADMK